MNKQPIKDEITWWLSVLTVALIPAISYLVALSFKVNAQGGEIEKIETYIESHNKFTQEQTSQLNVLDFNVKQLNSYFGLKPKQ